ncbi:MAG TPA: DUF6677 family protein [Gemmataceae bacterium]|nr:DUF6677 family protein [Gemmataceae bacterium]
MSSAPTAPATATPQEPSLLAAFLSYLIPGLGQIYQGRYGKGILFMVSLLGMFMLGQAMGNWQNVYIQSFEGGPNNPRGPGSVAALVNRWHYGGQFWIGIAAWPALWQHFNFSVPNKDDHPFWHNFQKMPNENDVNQFIVNSDKTPDLGWVYTVVAGMLNILVIYDAYAGPVVIAPSRPAGKEQTVPEQAQTKPEGAG